MKRLMLFFLFNLTNSRGIFHTFCRKHISELNSQHTRKVFLTRINFKVTQRPLYITKVIKILLMSIKVAPLMHTHAPLEVSRRIKNFPNNNSQHNNYIETIYTLFKLLFAYPYIVFIITTRTFFVMSR